MSFFDKLQKIFETQEFKEFSEEYLNNLEGQSACMLFIYYFTLYTNNKLTNKNYTEKELAEILKNLILDKNTRLKMIEYFNNSKINSLITYSKINNNKNLE